MSMGFDDVIRRRNGTAYQVDQASQVELVANDLRVAFAEGSERDGIHDVRDRRDAANLFEVAVPAEFLGDGHRVDPASSPMQPERGLTDEAVGIQIEVLRLDDIDDFVDHIVGEQHTAE